MSIANLPVQIQYTGNGSLQTYSFSFEIFVNTDVDVYLGNTLNVLNTDYTVTFTLGTAGGNVMFTVAPGNAVVITLARQVTLARTTQYQEGGDFSADAINEDLDLITARNQEQAFQLVNRVLNIPITDSSSTVVTLPVAATRANLYLAFDSSGNTIVTEGSSGGTPIATQMVPFVQSTSNAAAQATLGLGSAATLTAGTGANNAVQLTSGAKLPAVDGSHLSNLPVYSGYVNKLRNSSMAAWFHGTNTTISNSSSPAGGWACEGVYVIPTGATVTAERSVNTFSQISTYWLLELIGNSGVTNLTIRFPIESYDTATLAKQVCTFQMLWQNNTGSTLAPTITVLGAGGGQDNWTSTTTILSATSMQSLASGAAGMAAYTFNTGSVSTSGMCVDISFGAVGSGYSIFLAGGFDFRATPFATLGLNSNPPLPEIRTMEADIMWCQRFYCTSYDNAVATGTATHTGMLGGFMDGSTDFTSPPIQFPVRMRAAPTVSYWDGAGTANKYSSLVVTTWTDDLSPGASGGAINIGTAGFLFYGDQAANDTNFIHYAADATIAGA